MAIAFSTLAYIKTLVEYKSLEMLNTSNNQRFN